MATPMRVDGVDISHHQSGKIDWNALKKAGVKWMYHKSTEGSTFKDQNYESRRKEAAKAGVPFGAYHFARPSLPISSDAIKEAQFFVSVANPKPGDLRPCLDIETREKVSNGDMIAWVDIFIDEVRKLTGVFPVIYTPYRLSPRAETSTLFWVPRYNNSNLPPARRWDIWQFSNGIYGNPNHIPGLGHVDINHSNVSLERLLIPEKKPTRGRRVDSAISKLNQAEKIEKDGTKRDKLIKRARRVLRKIQPKMRRK